MSGAAQKGMPGGASGTSAGAIGLIFAMVMVMIYGTMFEKQVLGLKAKIAYYELMPIYYTLKYTGAGSQEYRSKVLRAIRITRSKPPELNNRIIGRVYAFIWKTYRWIVIPLLVLGMIRMLRMPIMRYRRVMDLEQLIHHNRDLYPEIRPVARRNIHLEDPDRGPWARKATTFEFAAHYGLLHDDDGQPVLRDTREIVDAKITQLGPVGFLCNTFRRAEADRVFADQLGEPWRGPERLPPLTRALYAALMARVVREKAVADRILEQLNLTFIEAGQPTRRLPGILTKLFGDGSRNYHRATIPREVDAVIAKYSNDERVLKITTRHYYTNVVMSRMLEEARTSSGVLLVTKFIWLKPVDRVLWYSLHQVGMREANLEAGGVRAHLLAETHLGCAICEPMVGPASLALADRLSKQTYLHPYWAAMGSI